MASTGIEADNSRPPSQATLRETDASNNELCELCLEALTINDQLAGGTTRVNTSNGTTTLDLSGFRHKDSVDEPIGAIPYEREFYHCGIHRDIPLHEADARWKELDSSSTGTRKLIREERASFCGSQRERLVTLPLVPEKSASGVGTCRLCLTLRDLFNEQYADKYWWDYHGSTLRVTMQYEWSEYRSYYEDEDEAIIPPSQQTLDWLAVLVICPPHMGVTCPHKVPEKRGVYTFDVMAWPGPCQEWLTIENTPPDPDGPMSDENVAFMREWIDECINDHEDCKKKSSKPTFLPSRLLDLGDYNESSVKLIECSQTRSLPHPETQLQYATLSYCWGSSLTMTTTTENKFKHVTIGIEVHSMPATFQDAIYVAKKLGIQYLWIDALCIIQDDQDDWETEAVMMCDVFAHSKVTISAAKSSSSAQQFLQRSFHEILTLDFHSKVKPDVWGKYSIRLIPRNNCPGQQDVAKSAWKSRAWVFQEQIMSTRQLVFGNTILQFECNDGVLLDDGEFEPYLPMPISHPSNGSSYHWDLVPAYSLRKLTHASDRLKAISGVANFIESRMPTDEEPTKYLVGLWENEYFHIQLRWACTEPSLSRTELMELLQDRGRYIAPSWSWASRNTGVDYPEGPRSSAIRVIKSDLRASHKSAMVSVRFGSSITISGKFRQTPVEPSSGYPDPDGGRYPQWPHRCKAYSDYGCTSFWLDWVPKKDDDEESKFQRQLCLFLTSVTGSGILEWTGVMGLVLAPVFDTETGISFYYRVGVFLHEQEDAYTSARMLVNLPDREITIR